MANKFDPYRDAVVVETKTIWPAEFDEYSAGERARIESQLHAEPQACQDLDYERMHTGFSRVVTVTQADLDRLG